MGWLELFGIAPQTISKVGKLYTTDRDRIEAETNYQKAIQEPTLAQIDVNKIYASSSLVFNSAWMPLIGWSAGFLVLLYYAPQIMIITYVWGKNCIESGNTIPFPMKSDEIINLVYLLFGMGGLGIAKGKFVKN